MARSARVARVASRKRVENVTADKTLTQSESGESYVCSGSSAVTLTLPEAGDGAYFEIFSAPSMTQTVSITGSNNIVGGLFLYSDGGADSNVKSDEVPSGCYGVHMTSSQGGMGVVRLMAQNTGGTYSWLGEGHISGTYNFTT